MSAVVAVKPGKSKKRTGTTVALATAAILLQPSAIATQMRECGCPLGQRCDCAPRLRIFDPTGRFLLSPVYY